MDKLSVLIPAFNEEDTILEILQKVCEVKLIHNLEKEIIVIDDCSTDKTAKRIKQFLLEHPEWNIKFLEHPANLGKGAAIHTGIKHSTGDYILIQDADLEYDPEDYNHLLSPVLNGQADVVYGSRFVGGRPHRILFFWHSIGNKFLTFVSNMFTNLNLTDMEVGYKLFKASVLKNLQLKERSFGFEPEVTARISRIKGIRIYEVGISYYGRTYAEGKKIKWIDGVRALYCILKYNIFSR